MKGWQIFLHSLRQVTGNFEAALRVSGVLYLAQFAVALLLLGGAALLPGGTEAAMQGGPGAGAFIAALLTVFVAVMAGLWTAVGWHRYVLLSETSGFLPVFRSDRMWAYFLRSLGYGLIIVLCGAIWGAIVGFLIGSVFMGSVALMMVLMTILIQLPLVALAFRLTTALPAAALGATTDFWAGWKATEGQTGDFVVLALIAVGATLVLNLIGLYVFSGIMILSLLWTVILGWLQMMVGISILTTLYGHYIEKRPLV